MVFDLQRLTGESNMTDTVTRDSSHQHERGSNKLGLERLRVGVGDVMEGQCPAGA